MKLLLILSLFFCVTATAQHTTQMVIHFDFDKSTIREEDAARLSSLFPPARLSAIKTIELYGHCDFIGNNTYNDALSDRRVEQTKAYLLKIGVRDNVFIKNEGFGKRKPINENSTDEERFANRRVELVINWNDSGIPDTTSLTEQLQKKTAPQPELKIDSNTKVGTTIILKSIQFIPGRHYLLPESLPLLDELYKALVDFPTLVIEIQGHVCCTPDDQDGYDLDNRTLDLSVQRAKVIYEHLIERGIASSRLSYIGFGGSRKLHRFERNEFERQENRRVELKIVSR